MLLQVILVFAIIDFLFFMLIHWLRKDFQWLITDYKDLKPTLDSRKVDHFFKESFDPELGWIRKANSTGKENTRSMGQVSEVSSLSDFSINAQGFRANPGYEDLPIKITTHGDSFVFSRQVNDNETWQNELSRLTNSNVINAGVGNHGADQGLIRFQRDISKFTENKIEFAILGAVPETLCRVHNYWKHYFEYGNLLAFKPRFKWNSSGQLIKVPLLIRDKAHFLEILNDPHQAQIHEFWFQTKFKKDLLSFPYTLSLFKNPGRHFPLVAALICSRIGPKKLKNKFHNSAWNIVLKQNMLHCKASYNDPERVRLLSEIVNQFSIQCREINIRPVYVIFPYLEDLKEASTGKVYYDTFKDELKRRCEDLIVIDLTEEMSRTSSPSRLYTNEFYGAHFSPEGNRLAAKIIYEAIKNLKSKKP